MSARHRISRSGPEGAFERKVLLSKWALLFEQVWPRAWLILGLAGLFIAVSLAGLWPRLPELPHKIILGLFGVAFLGAFVALFTVRWPSRESAIRRAESISGVRHRPASSYEDTLTLGATDARTAALWRMHRQRLAQVLGRLRVGVPAPRTDRHDPFALRALLLLGVFVLTIVVGDSAADRLWSAFRLSPLAKGAEARLDAWITPPSYTAKPPLMLADGGLTGARAQLEKLPGTIEVPDKSVLIVRGSGAGMRDLALEVPGEDGTRRRLEAPPPANPADVMELKLEVTRSGTVSVQSGGMQVASWTFSVTPDHAPKITMTKQPERSSPRGSLKLFYKVEDDYGVVSAQARIRRIAPKKDTSSTAWAREPKTGARLPYERPPVLALNLPGSYPKKAEGHSLHEIGEHPWAGMKVELTLIAKDLAGQVGKSETIEITLPERRFTKPLARSVVEQRRKLAEDSRDRLMVARAIDALTTEPAGFIDDLQVFLGLRSAYWRLKRDATRAGHNSVIEQLWHVALRIEEGDLSDAERELRAAQERLQKALREGASEEEIQRLLQELRQALAQYLDQLTRQAEGQPMQGLNPNLDMLTQQDLEELLRNLERMARSGNRDMAEQMLNELRDLLDRLQTGRMGNQQETQRLGKMMDEFGEIIGKQQQLLDDTFGQHRKDGQRGEKGEKGQKGEDGKDDAGGLGDRQRELRERLGRLQRGMKELGMQPPGQLGGAEKSMERAEEALRDGDLAGGAEHEARVLEQLRQGARELAQRMLRQLPSRYGMNGPRGELDPMGRPPRQTDGPDPGNAVKIPDEIDVQRAREILEELRRRLGETTRPPIELEYLERLLKRF
jgi:uncharacterized protein (TIGR02302 family)